MTYFKHTFSDTSKAAYVIDPKFVFSISTGNLTSAAFVGLCEAKESTAIF